MKRLLNGEKSKNGKNGTFATFAIFSCSGITSLLPQIPPSSVLRCPGMRRRAVPSKLCARSCYMPNNVEFWVPISPRFSPSVKNNPCKKGVLRAESRSNHRMEAIGSRSEESYINLSSCASSMLLVGVEVGMAQNPSLFGTDLAIIHFLDRCSDDAQRCRTRRIRIRK